MHLKNPIILTNLGEPIPTPATFKEQGQRHVPCGHRSKGLLLNKLISHLPTPT